MARPRRTYAARDPAVTSRIMSAVRSRDTSIERLLRRELTRRGLRYRLHANRACGEPIIGRPDFVFAGSRLIVFLDSDFWHGRLLERGRKAVERQFRPELRAQWVEKIVGNATRDLRITEDLRSRRWCVMRFWQSDLRTAVQRIAGKIERVARHARGHR